MNPETAMFRVAKPSIQPLLIHQNINLGGIFVDHEADRPLVLEDLATWFNHARYAPNPGMMLPGRAAQGKDMNQLYRNTRPSGAAKEVFGANILGFAAGDVDGHAAVENVRAWLRQCDNENAPGPMWAFRRSEVWMLGFKVEGAQQLFQMEDGSRLEVLGGTHGTHAKTQATPLFRIRDSEVSAHFSIAGSKVAQWAPALEGTQRGEPVSVPFHFAPLGIRPNEFIVSFCLKAKP